MKVTFIKHSCFLIETDTSYLLFDYWKGQLPQLKSDKNLFVFASHVHHDHYSKDIYKLENACKNVEYILSSDIEEFDTAWKKAAGVHFLKPYDHYEGFGIKVDTLFSTDQGLAFMVEVDGQRIYHAGDLHMWYWRGEPDEDNTWHQNRYKEEIDKLKDKSFDVSFVVLDPRQEEASGWGMDYFLSHVKSRYVFPMHCWGKFDLIADYKKKNDTRFLMTHIMGIEHVGQEFEVY